MTDAPTPLDEGPRNASPGEPRLTPQDSYRATLHCRRCNSPYCVPKQAERFLYWWCHRREDGVRCGTMNIWKGETRHG